MKQCRFDLPDGSKLTDDQTYNDYSEEDLLEEVGFKLTLLRMKISLRPLPPWVTYLMSSYRKLIETMGSLVEQLLPKHFYTFTAARFELKVADLVLACSINYLINVSTG